MREAFREHHKPADDEQKRLWQSCLFVLDTNVLLNIYRYADHTREDLFRVLRHIGPRVWIPYQVAKEFYAHRLGLVREQRSQFKVLADAVKKLSKLDDGQFRKSGFLKIDELHKMLQPAVEQVLAFIAEQEQNHPDLLESDPYLEALVSIVGDSIGIEQSADQRVREAADAQDRIDREQPPGYKDAKKPVPDRYGDVFIWFEIVRLAAAQKRSIMFVTDDEKEDWWHIVEGRKLGPRPELRAEIRKQSPVEFGICNPARLLQNIGSELSVSVDLSSLEDAKKIAEELRSTQYGRDQWKAWSLEMRAELAVEKWLQRGHPEATFARFSGRELGGDFIMIQGALRTSVEIVAAESLEAVPVLLKKVVEFASRRSLEQLLVIVGARERLADATKTAMAEIELPETHPPIVLGYLEDGAMFYRLSDL